MSKMSDPAHLDSAARRPFYPSRPLLPFLLSLLLVSSLPCPALAIKLKFIEEECMHYKLHMYNAFYGSFVSMPDPHGITFKYKLTITSPAGTKVYESEDDTEVKFNLVPYESGNYKFCLALAPSRAARHRLLRDVVWDLHISGAENHHDHMKEDETKHLWQLVSQIDSQVQQLKSTQQFLYWRERRHRQTVDSTNARVYWYAMARNAVLLATSIGQVLLIRRMFAK